jgi:hypothetical protein
VFQSSALTDDVQVPVFAVYVQHSVRVDDRSVDAPLVSVGMLAIDGRILELPFGLEVGAELGNVVGAGRERVADRATIIPASFIATSTAR